MWAARGRVASAKIFSPGIKKGKKNSACLSTKFVYEQDKLREFVSTSLFLGVASRNPFFNLNVPQVRVLSHDGKRLKGSTILEDYLQ